MLSFDRAKKLRSTSCRAIGVLAATVVLIGGLSLSDPSDPASAAQPAIVALADQAPIKPSPEIEAEPDRNVPTIEPAPLPDGPVQRTDGPLELAPEPLAPPVLDAPAGKPTVDALERESLAAAAAGTNTLQA